MMKKKIFTLMTLLLCICSGAWATDYTWGLTQADLTSDEGTGLATTTTYTGAQVTSFVASSAEGMGTSSSTRDLTNGTTNLTAAAVACTRNKLCPNAEDFVENCYFAFTITVADGYKLNISQFFGDLYYSNSRKGKYKFAVYSGSTKVWEAESDDHVAIGHENISQKTLSVSSVAALQGLTGAIQIRMVWYQGGSSSYVALKDFNITGTLEEDTRILYKLTTTASPANSGTIGYSPVGGSYEEGTEVTLTAAANDGYYFVNWTDDNNSDAVVSTSASYVYTMGASAAAFTAHFAKYPVITFSKGESEAEGTVPAATYTTTGSFNIPANNSLYVAGKTLTAWNDGTNDYAIGATISDITGDITLTPKFTANNFELAGSGVTVYFPFTQNGGAPVMAAQFGSTITSTMSVAQANLQNDFIDVLMSVDASNGKFNNNQGNLDACQINKTTIISIPAVFAMQVTLDIEFETSYLGNDASNRGVAADGSTTWTYSGETGGTVNLTINEGENPKLMTVTYPKTAITMSITSAGWASFSNISEVAIPEGVTAYYASANTASSVTLTEITGGYIPANTGVIIQGAQGNYQATVTATGATLPGTNLLKPWTTAGTPSDATYYTLAAGPTFAQSTGGTLAAGKAYLVLSGTTQALSILFDTTGIQTVERSQDNAQGEVYNLAGQRVAQPTKGLYIVNGKKVVIK